MKANSYVVLLALVTILLGAPTAFAHHSFAAEFDRDRPIEFTGIVKQVDWVNPHGFMHVEVTDGDGVVSTYKIIIGAPISLYRQGWKKESVPPGTVVHFEGSRARNPNSRNVNGTVTGPDGNELWRGEGPEGAL